MISKHQNKKKNKKTNTYQIIIGFLCVDTWDFLCSKTPWFFPMVKTPDVFFGSHQINGHSRILNWRYLPYIRPIFQAYVREYPHNIWPYMVRTYLHVRILKFPLIKFRARKVDPSYRCPGSGQWSQIEKIEHGAQSSSGIWLVVQ